MHSNMRTAHRDIKLDNTVIMDDAWMSHVPGKGPGKSKTRHCPVGRIALIDFQFAYHWSEGSQLSKYKGLMGTPVYMSPELLALRFDTHSPHITGVKHAYDPVSSDIWACGIMLVAMLIGAFPFDDYSGEKKTMTDLEESIYGLQKHYTWKQSPTVKPYLKYISASCIDMIDGMLSFDPSKRSSMSRIQMHPWMKDFESKTFQDAWNRLQEQDRRIQNSVENKLDDESRTRIGQKLASRNKAVMEMMKIACRPYQEHASILNPDDCPDDQHKKELKHSLALFESPDIAGLVDHHSFCDEQSLEISMGMTDLIAIPEGEHSSGPDALEQSHREE